MTFIHFVYTYQSRNQRSLLRKEINYLIEKYKRNKETKKLQFEIEELRRLRKVSIMMLLRNNYVPKKMTHFIDSQSHKLQATLCKPFKEKFKLRIRIRSPLRPQQFNHQQKLKLFSTMHQMILKKRWQSCVKSKYKLISTILLKKMRWMDQDGLKHDRRSDRRIVPRSYLMVY